MRIRMTDPAAGQKGKAREVSDSYGLRLVSQGQAVVLPPLSMGGAVTGGDAGKALLGDAAPAYIVPAEKEPVKGERKPTAPQGTKGTKGAKGGAGDGA